MRKKIISLLLVVVLLCGSTGCAKEIRSKPGAVQPTPQVALADESEAVIYTDDCGREVEIPKQITAIAASGPLSQIILFAIAPEMLVGLADEFSDNARGIIPDTYFDLPCFGQLYGSASLNAEALAAAAPQLIIDIGEAKKTVSEDMDHLQAQTQIPSIHIEATLATMPEAYRRLGSILGKEGKGEELARFCEKVYNRTVSIMDKVGDHKLNALYVLGEDGLNVLSGGSYHAEVFDLLTNNLAVLDNPTAKGTGNAVSMEQIALWNPDFILYGPDSIYDSVSDRQVWKEIRAIQNGSYLEVPETPYNWMGMPPAVQRYLGLIWLTAALYPEYCDYDVKKDIMEYYKLFYGCTLTEDQYDALTKNAFPVK